jgi:hypothetical protein
MLMLKYRVLKPSAQYKLKIYNPNFVLKFHVKTVK